MKKTVIEEPIVLIKLKGNHKKKASMLNIVAITTYEKHLDQTYIIVKVEKGYNRESEIFQTLKEVLNTTDEVLISKQYSENGINFISK